MKQLPKYIDPKRLAEANTELAGKLPLHDMQRLRQSLLDSKGDVELVILFGRDDSGLSIIKGHLEADLILACQRCMQAMIFKITTDFALSPVYNDAQAVKLPQQYEPLLLNEDEILLQTMVEDELLLNLPIVAMHDANECAVNTATQICEALSAKEEKVSTNPFSALAKLKGRSKE